MEIQRCSARGAGGRDGPGAGRCELAARHVTIGGESAASGLWTDEESLLRRIFSDWHLDERAWIVAPLALWMVAFLVRAVWQMARQKRALNRRQVVRDLGPGWRATFVVAVLWLVGWAVGLTVIGR